MLVDSLEERLEKWPEYNNAFTGEPGRYDEKLGVKLRESEEGWGDRPMVVFSHPHALGYVTTPPGRSHNVGERKALGPLRGTELIPWGNVHDVMKLYDYDYSYNQCACCKQEIL